MQATKEFFNKLKSDIEDGNFWLSQMLENDSKTYNSNDIEYAIQQIETSAQATRLSDCCSPDGRINEQHLKLVLCDANPDNHDWHDFFYKMYKAYKPSVLFETIKDEVVLKLCYDDMIAFAKVDALPFFNSSIEDSDKIPFEGAEAADYYTFSETFESYLNTIYNNEIANRNKKKELSRTLQERNKQFSSKVDSVLTTVETAQPNENYKHLYEESLKEIDRLKHELEQALDVQNEGMTLDNKNIFQFDEGLLNQSDKNRCFLAYLFLKKLFDIQEVSQEYCKLIAFITGKSDFKTVQTTINKIKNKSKEGALKLNEKNTLRGLAKRYELPFE